MKTNYFLLLLSFPLVTLSGFKKADHLTEPGKMIKMESRSVPLAPAVAFNSTNDTDNPNVRISAMGLNDQPIYVSLITTDGSQTRITAEYEMTKNDKIAFDLTPSTAYQVMVITSTGERFVSANTSVPGNPHYNAHTISLNPFNKPTITNWVY